MSGLRTEGNGVRLSTRELEVAGMVAQGLTNREIAAKLFISERTVDGHLEHIREKLGVNTRSQVTAWVVRHESAAIAAPAAAPATMVATRRWAFAHPRAWVGAALVLALLAAGVGVLRLTAPPPPIIQTVAGSKCPKLIYPGGCFGGDASQTAVGAQLARPTSVAIDRNGDIYIADYGNGRIRRVSGGIMTTLAGSGKEALADGVLGISVSSASLGLVSAVALDSHGVLYMLTSPSDRLEVWKLVDRFMYRVVSLGPSNPLITQFAPNLPVGGLAITNDGVLFIADRVGNRVMKYDGELTPYAGTGEPGYADGGDAKSAKLDWPIGLALDSRENLYIADTGNNRIRKVDRAKGTITTVAGGAGEFEGNTGDDGPATRALLSFPFGVAVARDGTIVFTDTGNHRLRAVTPRGTIYAVAGTGQWGFSGDSKPALEAEFDGPEGLALDSKGNLFIADTENQRVREIPHLLGPG